MKKGFVYILTNPSLDGWVKIGMTERNDIEKRLNELNSPANIPLSYRCYAIYEVNNPHEVEKCIHSLIDKIDDSLHARETLNNGKIREREFFKISPETAYGIFKDVAKLRGDSSNLRLYTPTVNEVLEENFAESRRKKANSSFKSLDILIGEELSFLYDDNLKVLVSNDKNQVLYEGIQYSLSALAKKILFEKYGWSENLSVNGWRFFTKDGTTLSDLRDNMENTETEN